MSWDCDKFQIAITAWLIEELKRLEIPHAEFERESKLSNSKDGRIFRTAKFPRKDGKRRQWKIKDICLIANYFNEHLSYILAKIEVYYKTHTMESMLKKIDLILQENIAHRTVKSQKK